MNTSVPLKILLPNWTPGDFEWYDPKAVTTEDGKLVFTLSADPEHDLNYTSGMLTSWNKVRRILNCIYHYTVLNLERFRCVSLPVTSKSLFLCPVHTTSVDSGLECECYRP